jgi:hypothetical protein
VKHITDGGVLYTFPERRHHDVVAMFVVVVCSCGSEFTADDYERALAEWHLHYETEESS